MDEFLRDIKDQVNDNDNSFPKEGAWQRFIHYRKNRVGQTNKPAYAHLYGVAAIGLLLFLASNAFWYNKNKLIQSSIADLQTDTIYITKYISNATKNGTLAEQNTDSSNALNANLNSNQQSITSKETISDLRKQVARLTEISRSIETKNQLAAQQLESLDQHTSEVIQSSDSGNKTLANLEGVPFNKNREITQLSLLERGSSSTIIRSQKLIKYPYRMQIKDIRKPKFIDYLTPKTLTLNASAGYIGRIEDEFGVSNGGKIKLGINSLLTDKLRLRASVSGNLLRKEIHNPSDFEGIVDLTIPENTLIREVYKREMSLSLRAGIDYLLNARKIWRPYVGLGYEKLLTFQNKLKLELTSPAGDSELIRKINSKYNNGDYLYLSFGTDINLNKNIDAFLSASYFQGLRNRNEVAFTLSPGIYYHF